jgi:hypothetical protein
MSGKRGRIITGPGGPEEPTDNEDVLELPPLPALKLFVLDWYNAKTERMETKEVHAHVCNFTEHGGVNFVAFKKLSMEDAMEAMKQGAPPYRGRYVGCFPNYVFMEEIDVPEGRAN